MRSWARDIALGLLLATAIPAPVAYSAQTAEQILLDKARYWRLKDRPDLAIEALQKLLSINPNQPDALYQYGIIDVQQNKLDDAKAYLARLRTVDPSSQRIADLENAIRAGQVSPSELSEARRLAQAGQFAQATAKYQQTFKGAPPPTFGIEYYQTLAGTQQGWSEARQGLARLVQEAPNDSKARLALAEVLTYHTETRAEGIRALAVLSDDPVVGPLATQSWKKAVFWLGGSAEDRALYESYLRKFPQDAEVRQHMAEATKPGAPGPASASAAGYGDLNRGNLAAAERAFEGQLRRNPNDADAIAGLGLIRLRQQRFGEARDLLGRAMNAAPARRGQWAAAYGSAVFWVTIREAKSAADAGNYAAAESAYRRALSAQPDNTDAIVGLYTALTAEGKTAEAAELAARIARLDPSKMAGINRARSDILRADAKSMLARGDTPGAVAKYQEAIAVDPGNGWARLDLARLLMTNGDTAQAYAVINPNAAGVSVDSLQAAAIFYSEQNRPAEALSALDRIPQGSRNAETTALRNRVVITAEIAHAKQLARSGNGAAARNILLVLNSRPPVTTDKTQMVADALIDIGDPQAALQIARPTNAANKSAVIDYATLLFRAGQDGAATAYLTEAEASGRITGADRRDLENLKCDIAARRADQLRERNDFAGAYDQLSALLIAYPNNPTLLNAAGRIYASAGQSSVAMTFFDAAFRQAPNDVGVIRGAVGGAIQAGDLDRARAYLAYGMQEHPTNPRLVYLQAEIARADGNNGVALYNLQAARALDMQQSGITGPVAMGPPIMGPGSPGRLPPNPFRQSQAEPVAGAKPATMAASEMASGAVDELIAPPVPASSRFLATVDAAALQGLPTHTVEPIPAPTSRRMFKLAASTEESGGSTPPAPLPPAPAPLQDTVISADSDDLVAPPYLNDRAGHRPATAPGSTSGRPQIASLPTIANPDFAAGASEPGVLQPTSLLPAAAAPGFSAAPAPAASLSQSAASSSQNAPSQSPRRQQLADLPPLPPPPIPGYQAPGGYQGYPAQYNQQYNPNQYYPNAQYAPNQPAPNQYAPAQHARAQYAPSAPPAQYSANQYPAQYYPNQYYPPAQPQQVAPLQPLPPPPIPGYQAPATIGQPGPVPQDSLELDIDRSIAAINAESSPTIQGGLGFRIRGGESGLSQLDDFTVPLESTFSPFYTGTVRLQAIPTFLTAGTVGQGSLLRFGSEPAVALIGPPTFNALVPAGSQTANGVSLNAAYSYQMFSGEIGSTPLGFPIENLVGRVALNWPGPASATTALPSLPLPPISVSNPLSVRVELSRQPITESMLSFAGQHDPVTGRLWGGVLKNGGTALVSYDDGDVGVYGGAGGWSIDGTAVAGNSEIEGLVGAYVRPYRVGNNAFKVGINLSYMGYDKNLRFFTFGQGGYFSPQNYLQFAVPIEYAGKSGRFAYLVGGALGVQTFSEDRSPVFPNNAAAQSALANAFGSAAFYPSRTVTGPAFAARGQVEYQLDNGFSIGALATFDNAQNYNEGVGKLYLRKTFGASPPAAMYLPNSLPGRL